MATDEGRAVSAQDARGALDHIRKAEERGGTVLVRGSTATESELKNIQLCLRHRPAKADKTALISAWAASSAAIVSVLKNSYNAGNFQLGVFNLVLFAVAVVAAYAHWQKYRDARNAKDPHLDLALADVERLIAAQAAAENSSKAPVRIEAIENADPLEEVDADMQKRRIQ